MPTENQQAGGQLPFVLDVNGVRELHLPIFVFFLP
jgi:hypothetical protein